MAYSCEGIVSRRHHLIYLLWWQTLVTRISVSTLTQWSSVQSDGIPTRIYDVHSSSIRHTSLACLQAFLESHFSPRDRAGLRKIGITYMHVRTATTLLCRGQRQEVGTLENSSTGKSNKITSRCGTDEEQC